VNVLVAGGAGFIGSHLVDRLLAEDHAVDVVDDLSSGSLANLSEARALAAGSLKIHSLDVRAGELDELLARREPEVVFHLASLTPAQPPRLATDVAVMGTLNLLDSARRAGVGKVVVTLPATSLYGDVPSRELPVKEGREVEPRSIEQVAARTLIDLLGVYRAEHGLEHTALALTNVYGPRQRPADGVVAAIASALSAGESPELFGDGRQTRDFLYVDDAVDALVRGASKGSGLVVNVGTGVQTSIRDLVDLMGGRDTPVESAPARPGDLARFSVSPVRARIHLGWSPWTTLRDGLDQLRAAR
jgi:UDP-glucose 4-epimerase